MTGLLASRGEELPGCICGVEVTDRTPIATNELFGEALGQVERAALGGRRRVGASAGTCGYHDDRQGSCQSEFGALGGSRQGSLKTSVGFCVAGTGCLLYGLFLNDTSGEAARRR